MAQINIPFESSWKSVAISVSGGADSALLAYLVCDQAPDNFLIHVISHIRMWKTRPWQQQDSLSVFKWLEIRFPNLKFKRHTNFIAPDLEYGNIGPSITDEFGKMVSGDNIQQRAYGEYICKMHDIDAYYNGVTRNPPVTNFSGMVERDVDKSENNKHLEIMQHMDVWAIHPFRFIDKSEIVKKYKELGLMDLFNITRSCEGEFKDITYKNYTSGQYVPICGACFWCKEREWAIEQNK
jgi:hypothetical protein